MPVQLVPRPEIVAEGEERLLDFLFDDFVQIESLAISAREAARRGDRDEIDLRLRKQMADAFRHAVQLHNLLKPKGDGA